MFGYVTVNPEALTQAQRDRFQAFYCGLCRCLRREYGLKGQLTLSFDMTFLLITLSSLYEPEEQSGVERCAPHPRKKHAWVENEFTAYAADMNLALAYHKLMDDWADERNLVRRVGAEALKRGYRRVEARWGEKCAAIEKGVRDLSAIEERREMDIDAPANCCGELLGELFVYRHDQWEDALRAMEMCIRDRCSPALSSSLKRYSSLRKPARTPLNLALRKAMASFPAPTCATRTA